MTVPLLAETFDLGHLTEALVHYNEAMARGRRGAVGIDLAEPLFFCLNKLQTAALTDSEGGEIARFKRLVLSVADGSPELFNAEVRELAALSPSVLNHQVLRDGGYRPNAVVDPDLQKAAAEEHVALGKALDRWVTRPSSETQDTLARRLAEVLYVVRSNIAHGEKTPSGPDYAKRRRDEAVCALVVPVQLRLIDLLLGHPSRRLIVYGTLAPGGVNHAVAEPIGGTWSECQIEAIRKDFEGLPTLTWLPGTAAPIDVLLLESAALETDWHRLDAFEGDRYCRQLITATSDGGVVVANAYLGPE